MHPRGTRWVLGVLALMLVVTATGCTDVFAKGPSGSTSSAGSSSTVMLAPAAPSKGAPIPPVSPESNASTGQLPSLGFWAVWGPASRDEAVVRPVAAQLSSQGFQAGIIYTPEWEGLSMSPWYVVCIGPYASKAVALKALAAAQSRGFKKGYRVTFSGATTLDRGADWVKPGARL